MERQIPKNVRQIGNVSDSPKIYVEDYVDTFFTQLCEKAGDTPVGAFLVGEMQSAKEEEYVYIYGAIKMHNLKKEGDNYTIDDETWKKAYEDCKLYFEDGEMLGWFVTHPGTPLQLEGNIAKLHRKSFPKKNTVFIMKDSVEKEEAYFVQKFNDLFEISGHYTYYEKNPSMQNYMIASRKKNGANLSETVEDRVIRDFRSVIKDKEERQQKKSDRMMHIAGAGLALVILAMFAVTISNLGKMESVQTALNKITEEEETSEEIKATQDKEETQEKKEEEEPEKGKEEPIETPAKAPDYPSPEENEERGDQKTEESEETKVQESAGQNVGKGVYIVEKGDTLAIISRKIYSDVNHVDAICKMNGIEDGNLIYVGQKLVLP